MRGTTLTELLARRAAAEPERPWLFYPDGPDWRWRGYGAAAALAAGRGEPPPEGVGEVVASLAREAGPAAWSTLARHLLPRAASGRGGEVTVLTRSPTTQAGRLLVAWSLLAGAALVLEPAAGARVPSAVRARPTLFLGDAAEVVALAAAARRYETSLPGGWWRRLRAALGRPAPPPRPFGRLHTLLLVPPEEGVEARCAAPRPAGPLPDAAFWQRHGVRCVDLRAVLL